jgi:hypothetical protein
MTAGNSDRKSSGTRDQCHVLASSITLCPRPPDLARVNNVSWPYVHMTTGIAKSAAYLARGGRIVMMLRFLATGIQANSS